MSYDYAHKQYPTHKVHLDKETNKVSFLTVSSVMTGDDVVDQDGNVGDLVWSNTSQCYIVLWKSGGMSELSGA